MNKFSLPKKKTTRERLTQLGLSLALAFLLVLLTQNIFFEFTPLKRAELSTIDRRYGYRGPIAVPQESLNVVIVEISQESFQSLPHKYPWPRSYYGHVVRNLKRAGALAVGFDMFFDQPNTEHPDDDEEFKRAILETGIIVVGARIQPRSSSYTLSNENYGNIFFDVDSAVGFANILPDDDGLYRSYRPFVYDQSRNIFYPTLAFGCLNKVFGKPPFNVPTERKNDFVFNNIVIPKNEDVNIFVNYYGPDYTFRHFKFADVIDDHEFMTTEEIDIGAEINTFDDPDIGYLASGVFKNKIVLIGSTMPEEKDLFPVAFSKGKHIGDNLMYGVEIHANVIQNVLDNNFLNKESQWINLFLVALFCSGTFLTVIKFRSLKFRYQVVAEILGIGFIICEAGLYVFVSFYLFKYFNYVTILFDPLLAVAVGYVGAIVYSYLTERKQKTFIKGMFGQYLSPAVVNELVEHPDKLRLGGERRELTVLFSDIVQFTSISEKLSPEELVTMLNDYLSAMTDIIFVHKGTLDKYIGDAVMAFWGAPIPLENHAILAITTALEMQKALLQMREKSNELGTPFLDVRIGINSGEMLVGNFGGKNRFDYTVISDSVNLASRLEGANKQYRTKILIGEQTYYLVKDNVIAREIDKLLVVGKSKPVTVYEILGLKGEKKDSLQENFLEVYASALATYRKREWKSAIELFQQALALVLHDYPSKMYIERSQQYLITPPPDDWDGVFKLTTKN
ncbi:MAG: adenylate/guanylate cyclase domain-containing protein [Ignavibacteriales bacterium]|nr:adenylate/guanylate cyclase domain-containing protein [Ignavibacteriales bacterium]